MVEKENPASTQTESAADLGISNLDDGDIQHGRRNQLKKKPVFIEVDEKELDAAEGSKA